jgi:outer membrane lipoprotein-sorting protein
MRNISKWFVRTLICAGLVAAGIIPVAAQTVAPAAMPTVDEILDKYVQAMGGKDAIQKLTSRVAKGTFELEQMPGDATTEIYQKAPNKSYTNTESASFGAYKRGFNGTVGWRDDPQAGLSDITGAQLADMKRGADFYRDIKLKELYPKRTLKGKESVNGKDAYVVELTPTEGSGETWSFDADTGLAVRVQSQMEGDNGLVEVDISLGDYREVDGVKYPYLIHQSFGQLAFTIKFTDVQQNVAIDDAKFDKPTQ